MKIQLLCVSSFHIKDDRYMGNFRQLPDGKDIVEIETQAPAIPGNVYTLDLLGVFPGAIHNVLYSVLSLRTKETLQATDQKTVTVLTKKQPN